MMAATVGCRRCLTGGYSAGGSSSGRLPVMCLKSSSSLRVASELLDPGVCVEVVAVGLVVEAVAVVRQLGPQRARRRPDLEVMPAGGVVRDRELDPERLLDFA